ncbi:MAG: hypothetical protein HPY64_03565 [Anaerolineae bacterium]|nr:hypothetical protein [Anaerolineae bacterium]
MKRQNAPALDEILFYIVAPIVAIIVGTPLAAAYLLITGLTLLVWAGLAAGAGLLAGLWGVYRLTLSAWHAAASPRREPRPALIHRFYEPQPARLMLVAEGGWFVIGRVLRRLRRAVRMSAHAWAAKSRAYAALARESKVNLWDYIFSVWLYGSAAGQWIGAGLHFGTAAATGALLAAAGTLILVAGALVSSLVMLLLGAFNGLQGALYRIYFRCPNCHAQMRIPVVICPACDRRHTRLWPSVYGVFYHTCDCGERLPTLDLLGRRRLVQRCPVCDSVLNEAIGRATNLHIPIVGGPSAGKTHYLVATVRELIERYAPAHNLTITMPDVQHRRDYEASVRLLRRGQQLRKTPIEQDSNTRAFNLQIKRRWHPVPTLLYLYDGAGEYYTSQDSAQQQVYYRYVNGLILIVDPFAVPAVYAEYAPRLRAEGETLAVNPQEPLSGIYERMIETLEVHYSLRRGVRFPHPIAVVLTKADAFDLDERIGGAAARRLLAESALVHSETDAINGLVEHFLLSYGEGNFVRNLRAQFNAVRFFSCSSTGRIIRPGDYSSLQPARVLEPLLWLMAQNNVLPMTQTAPDAIATNEARPYPGIQTTS